MFNYMLTSTPNASRVDNIMPLPPHPPITTKQTKYIHVIVYYSLLVLRTRYEITRVSPIALNVIFSGTLFVSDPKTFAYGEYSSSSVRSEISTFETEKFSISFWIPLFFFFFFGFDIVFLTVLTGIQSRFRNRLQALPRKLNSKRAAVRAQKFRGPEFAGKTHH